MSTDWLTAVAGVGLVLFVRNHGRNNGVFNEPHRPRLAMEPVGYEPLWAPSLCKRNPSTTPTWRSENRYRTAAQIEGMRKIRLDWWGGDSAQS